MNTLLLKYAVEVEHAGSITQAADNLYMCQPNLSKAVKELEDTLGISIFKRTSKGVVPTQKGEKFLKYAKTILSQLDAMQRLSENENSDKQVFHISIPRASYIAQAVTNFVSSLDMDKEIEVSVQETNSMQAIRNIQEGGGDLGIIRYPTNYESYFIDYLDEKEISYNTVWEFNCLGIMSKSHPLADCDELKCEDLGRYIQIKLGDTCVPYINAESGQSERSIYSNKAIYVYDRCSSLDLLMGIPTAYMWGSPIPEDLLQRCNLVQRRCKTADQTYKDVLVYPQGYSFHALDKMFMDKLYESKNQVSLKNYY